MYVRTYLLHYGMQHLVEVGQEESGKSHVQQLRPGVGVKLHYSWHGNTILKVLNVSVGEGFNAVDGPVHRHRTDAGEPASQVGVTWHVWVWGEAQLNATHQIATVYALSTTDELLCYICTHQCNGWQFILGGSAITCICTR